MNDLDDFQITISFQKREEARSENEKKSALFQSGYKSGEQDEGIRWEEAIDHLVPGGEFDCSPEGVAAYIQDLQRQIRQLNRTLNSK